MTPKRFIMCRNIKPLFNFDPPVTDEEIHAAALQFTRKVTGFNKVPHVNQAVFDRAVEDMTLVVTQLMGSLATSAEPRNREVEFERAKERSRKRFGK